MNGIKRLHKFFLYVLKSNYFLIEQLDLILWTYKVYLYILLKPIYPIRNVR